jgi:hypothetical protein
MTEALQTRQFGRERLGRLLAEHPRLAIGGSWVVILWESMFVGFLFSERVVVAALMCGVAIHLSMSIVMGLNRFLPIFVCGYPAVWYVSTHYLTSR